MYFQNIVLVCGRCIEKCTFKIICLWVSCRQTFWKIWNTKWLHNKSYLFIPLHAMTVLFKTWTAIFGEAAHNIKFRVKEKTVTFKWPPILKDVKLFSSLMQIMNNIWQKMPTFCWISWGIKSFYIYFTAWIKVSLFPNSVLHTVIVYLTWCW